MRGRDERQRASLRRAPGLFLPLLLAACTVIPHAPPPTGYPARPAPPPGAAPAPVPVPPPPAATAITLGVRPGPSVESLRLSDARATAALRSFAESCRSLLVRTDQSGLTRAADWQPACAAAPSWPADRATSFFAQYFETARVGSGQAYVTGYYEPEIAGVRLRQPGFDVPVYAVPPDLVRAWPAETPPEQRVGQPPAGRFDQTGQFVQYYDRAQIEDGALGGKGLEIGWAADPVEFFFLQIQGSGRLLAPDGTVTRIGFAGQNGLPYTPIGQLMRDKGLIGTAPGQYAGSMQGMMAYLREHPEDGWAMMRANRAYVFFRVLTGDGPVGAMNVPVRGKVTLAADPLFVPLGAPVWLSTDRADVGGLWVAQDTGGAIKGANRFDSFWGAGQAARTTAGGMAAKGEALLLLPRGAVARLAGTGAAGAAARK